MKQEIVQTFLVLATLWSGWVSATLFTTSQSIASIKESLRHIKQKLRIE